MGILAISSQAQELKQEKFAREQQPPPLPSLSSLPITPSWQLGAFYRSYNSFLPSPPNVAPPLRFKEQQAWLLQGQAAAGPFFLPHWQLSFGYRYEQEWYTHASKIKAFLQKPWPLRNQPFSAEMLERSHSLWFHSRYQWQPQRHFDLWAEGKKAFIGSAFLPKHSSLLPQGSLPLLEAWSLLPEWHWFSNPRLLWCFYLNFYKLMRKWETEWSQQSFDKTRFPPLLSGGLKVSLPLISIGATLHAHLYREHARFNEAWEDYHRSLGLGQWEWALNRRQTTLTSIGLYCDDYLQNMLIGETTKGQSLQQGRRQDWGWLIRIHYEHMLSTHTSWQLTYHYNRNLNARLPYKNLHMQEIRFIWSQQLGAGPELLAAKPVNLGSLITKRIIPHGIQ